MTTCDACHEDIPNARPGQRFHSKPRTCRQSWHRMRWLPGVVTSIRQTKSGQWSITVRYPVLPAVKNGIRVRLETHDKPRPDAS